MNTNAKTCPICPRHCNLSAPHCERGEEYSKTGILPQKQAAEHNHGHFQRLQFEKREQQLIMKYLHHAVGAADCGGITQENAEKMFSVFTEDETILLAKLLERLSDHWLKLAPNSPLRHSRH